MRVSISVALTAGLTTFAALGINPAPADADVIVASTSGASFGNDSVNWAQLGACVPALPNSFAATSADGLTLTVTGGGFVNGIDGGGGLVKTIQAPPGCSIGWFGNFAPGAPVIFNNEPGTVTLTFNSPISGVGAQFENLTLSDFTAEIDAYDGSTLLGSVTENGVGTGADDNSAIFLGVEDLTGADITSVVFSNSLVGFAFNDLSLIDSVPEPTSLALFGTALLGLGGLAAHRRKQA